MATKLNKRKKTHRDLINKARKIAIKLYEDIVDIDEIINNLQEGEQFASGNKDIWLLKSIDHNDRRVLLASPDLPLMTNIPVITLIKNFVAINALKERDNLINSSNLNYLKEFYKEVLETFGEQGWILFSDIIENIAYPIFIALNALYFKDKQTKNKIDMVTIYNLKDTPKSQIPKEGHDAYELYFELIKEFGEPEQWDDYMDDPDFKEVLEPIEMLIDYLNQNSTAQKKSSTKADKSKKEKRKTTEQKSEKTKEEERNNEQKPKKSAKRTTTRKKAKKKDNAKAVEHVDPQISVIRSFYLMLDKPVPRRRILNLYKKIERFATERIIRRKDEYANEIESISSILAQAYNKGKDPITISIDDHDKVRLKEIAYSQKVRESVRLIKAFIAFLTNQEKSKAERILERIDKAFDKDKIAKNDPYYEKVKKIRSWLEQYLSQNKPIKLNESQLSGFLNI